MQRLDDDFLGVVDRIDDQPELPVVGLKNDDVDFRVLGLARRWRADPELLAKYPFQSFIADSFANGDGNFRPRIPQYSKMQDAMGTAVNEVLHGTMTAQQALDAAQAEVAPLFP